ncbi:MAG: hypothetical protein IJQ71_11360 [Clostridia bacterium]|jgi:hypothetical protein|nr:hypothetical protein [Clostridia bacterium]
MKKIISLLLVLACVLGPAAGAFAETGFETIYGLFCSEEAFGPVYEEKNRDEEMEYEAQANETLGEEEAVKFCFVIFYFAPEYDDTEVWLLGENAEGAGKLVKWRSDYEQGATIMMFMLSKFADFRGAIARDVDFAIAYSFDGGQTMNTYDTVEAAEEFTNMMETAAATQGME